MDGGRVVARLSRSRSALLGGWLILALLAFTLAAPLATRHGPLESDFLRGMTAQETPVGPCADFPLGADHLFRDVLSRLAYGGRLSLAIAVSATALATALGTAVGLVAGWTEGQMVRVPWTFVVGAAGTAAAYGLGRGWLAGGVALTATIATIAGRRRGLRVDIDGWLMRLIDVWLAFPFLLLVMALGAALEQATVWTIGLTLGMTGWLGIARVLRAKTLQVRALEFVEASRALGQSTGGILLRHILPNVAGPLIVMSTILVSQMIVADSVLSYLGLGLSPPTPTWGRMLFEGKDDVVAAPWLVAAPACAILAAAFAFNLLGDGLRDALDPPDA
ncbi:MAG: ABC transporter permease [Polyangiaceae bacterium]|jgi:ABC-type dipeptide/oligopeptide/nickel transport system permease subunit